MFCGQKLGDSTPTGDETVGYDPEPDERMEYLATRTADAATPAAESAAELAPTAIAGYRLIRLLGSGGMGSVYEAEADGSGQAVAVKLLSRRLAANPASVERFRQEGRLASQIAHPRCVFVLRADTDAGRPFIIMELMPGRTLKDLVDDRGPLPVDEAILRILDVIDGLIEAHRLGVIHRDVKPSNCFLTEDDRVKVGDFGLSKSLAGSNGDKQLTHSGAFLGTVLFASPEQIRGEPVSYDTDVYAVCATLYYLLVGEAPHQHDSLTAALAKAISEAPPSLRVKCPAASVELDRLALRGLERDRDRRFQSLDELRDSLLGLLPARQIPARPRSLFLALLLDTLLLKILAIPLEFLRQAVGGDTPDLDHPLTTAWIQYSVSFLYFWLFEGLTGSTPGKRILMLRVVKLGGTGAPGLRAAGVRTLAFAAVKFWMLTLAGILAVPLGPVATGILAAGTFISGLVILGIQIRRTKHGYRGVHDFASGTRTVQLPRISKRNKLLSPFPNPLERVMKSAVALPETLGGFVIAGKICEIGDGGEVWIGEDKSLGRRVVLRVEPPGYGDDSLFDEPIVRPTRLRSVGHGTLTWGGGERAWIAFVAPAGSPLPDVVSPSAPLSWAEALPILDQLVVELCDGESDGSAPAVLSPEQLWVEPNGRLQLLDFPLPTGRAVAAGETKSRYPGGSFTPLGFVKQVTALMLEGAARTGRGRIRAPLPAHASAITDRLFDDRYSALAELRDDLTANHSQPPHLTAGSRVAHLTLQGLLLACGLTQMLLLSGFFNFFAAFAIAQVGSGPAHALKALESDGRRQTLLQKVRADEPAESALRQRLETALGEENYPKTQAALKHQAERTETEAEFVRQRLTGPERHLLKIWTDSNEERLDGQAVSPEFIDLQIQTAERLDQLRPGAREDLFRRQGRVFLITFAALILAWPLVVWPAFAVLFRGGIAFWFSGIALVANDGRPARRWRCALREGLIWLPLTACLLASLFIQWEWPTLVALRTAFWLAGVAVLPLSILVALRNPARCLADRMVGTFLVPS